MTDEIIKDASEGKIFLVAPSEKVEVTRFEGDMEKLGNLYWLGYRNAEEKLGSLMDYLKR